MRARVRRCEASLSRPEKTPRAPRTWCARGCGAPSRGSSAYGRRRPRSGAGGSAPWRSWSWRPWCCSPARPRARSRRAGLAPVRALGGRALARLRGRRRATGRGSGTRASSPGTRAAARSPRRASRRARARAGRSARRGCRRAARVVLAPMMTLVTNGLREHATRARRARRRRPSPSTTGAQRVEARCGSAAAIDRREVERRAARALGPGLVGIELAGEQAAGERAPRQDREALILRERHDLALDVAAGDRVVHLRAHEARQAVRVREARAPSSRATPAGCRSRRSGPCRSARRRRARAPSPRSASSGRSRGSGRGRRDRARAAAGSRRSPRGCARARGRPGSGPGPMRPRTLVATTTCSRGRAERLRARRRAASRTRPRSRRRPCR